MDDSIDTLGMATGTPGPGSLTGMETTAAAGAAPEEDTLRGAACPVDLSFLAASSRSGSLGRVGEYEIYGVLGRGAMGIVLKGHDRALNRVVAVKVQDPSLRLSRRVRARFLREARAVAAINHPNVVTIYKVNVAQDRPYLAMEFVAGTLRDRIKGGEAPGTVEVLRIALQVAEGLAAAHAQGVLHRDIKPANILLEDGSHRAKISDFGLALGGLASAPAIAPTRVAGTPAYMSPEQARNGPLDARSDLFSLGCVIYAMLAGRSPFGGETTGEAIASVLEFHPGPPPGDDHRCARPLGALVMRLLAKRPEDRPGSAAEVAATLLSLLAEANQVPSGEGLAPVPPGPDPYLAPAPASRGAWSSLAVASLAVAAVTGLVLWGRATPARVPILPLLTSVAGPRPVDPSPSPARTSWTVGRSGPADFRSLASAVASDKLGPGHKLVLIDAGRYEGPVVLDDPRRHRGLTIEATRGATLAAATGDSVVAIAGVSGVTLRGVRVDARDSQFAVVITGAAEGVTIDRAHFRSPADSHWTQVWIRGGASGSASRPIVVSGSTFEVGQGGVTIQGDRDEPVRHVEVRGNRFLGDDEHVHILQAVRDIKVAGNLFVGGQGLTLNLNRWCAGDILVANNTFFRAESWLHPAGSAPEQEGVVVCNNAILESDSIDVGNQDLARMAAGKWAFHHNVWEPSPCAVGHAESPVAERRPRLEVLSRDPERPEFLRPSPDSALAGDGAGGEHPKYAGALAPVPAPPGLREPKKPAEAATNLQ